MSKKKSLSNEDFLRRVRDYLPMDASVWNTDEEGRPCSCAIASGMGENQFYLFDAEAVLSASHAIEELALEEANGTLLALMQDFRNFEQHRERYWQLAATLQDVRVVARGKQPRRHGHLKFTVTASDTLGSFWTVLYHGHRCQALLLCRQANAARAFDERKFNGFYTFDPAVIPRVRRDIETLLAGRTDQLHEFDRLRAIDRAAREIQVEFERGRRAVEGALRRLRGEERPAPSRLATDLDQSLHRLTRLKERLTDLIPSRPSDTIA